MLNPENDKTEIMQAESDYTPPRFLSHTFTGRQLYRAHKELEEKTS